MKIDAMKKQEILNAINTLQQFVEGLEVSKGCISCMNWNFTKGNCGKYDLEPPQDILANGCDFWVIWDEIPF